MATVSFFTGFVMYGIVLASNEFHRFLSETLNGCPLGNTPSATTEYSNTCR